MRRLVLFILLAFAVYVAHQALLGSWIVDDAAISYAYARSLAQGHGLVAQPGVAPVEGFTNLLWVLILAATMALKIFDPVVAPKVLGAVFVLVAFVLTGRLVQADGRRPAGLAVAALVLTAGIPGFAIWCTSGLENALYAATLAWLATVCARPPVAGRSSFPAATAGFVAFLVFCTRPDGVLYLWVPALVMGLRAGSSRRGVVVLTAAFTGPWFALTAFRAAYFHDVMPNTFYAKQAEGASVFAWLTRELPLPLAALAAMALGALGVALMVSGAFTVGRRLRSLVPAERVRQHMPALFFVTAIVVYHVLRGDWMAEYRFATPAFLFAPAALLALVWDVAALQGRAVRARAVASGVTLAAVLVVSLYAVRHTSAFRARPTLSFQDVLAFSEVIDTNVRRFGPRPTVMTPDIGGALWSNRFTVVDYLGLIDRTIGRHRNINREKMRDYIVGVRRPDAVFLHSHFLRDSGLHDDPVFRAAYGVAWEAERTAQGLPASAIYHRLGREAAPPREPIETGRAGTRTGQPLLLIP